MKLIMNNKFWFGIAAFLTLLFFAMQYMFDPQRTIEAIGILIIAGIFTAIRLWTRK